MSAHAIEPAAQAGGRASYQLVPQYSYRLSGVRQ